MKYSISDDCIACGYCAVACPYDAIDTGYTKPRIMAGSQKSYADPFIITDRCVGCGQCLPYCPAGAISSEG